MKKKQILAFLAIFSVFFALLACVTVNVNFPESAAQKATDDYVGELYKAKEKHTEKKSSMLFSLIPEAWAGEFDVDSKKALEIREKMASRLDDVIAQKSAGFLGEANDGMLSIHDKTKIKKLLLRKLQKLVQSENIDRKELYQEVLRSNHLTKNHLINVEQSFARSFKHVSPSGTWVQNDDGSWDQKP